MMDGRASLQPNEHRSSTLSHHPPHTKKKRRRVLPCGAVYQSREACELLLDVKELALVRELGEEVLALAVLDQADVVALGRFQLFGVHAAVIAADHDLAALPGAAFLGLARHVAVPGRGPGVA